MQELVSPGQSETLVLLAAVVLTLVGAILGFRAAGKRGLMAALVGPLIWLLWQGHKYVTRYDSKSGYFGLDKVNVLLGEVVGFIILGAVLGWAWNRIGGGRKPLNLSAHSTQDTQEHSRKNTSGE